MNVNNLRIASNFLKTMFEKRSVPFPLDLAAILDISSSVAENSSQAQRTNDDDDDNKEIFSLESDNNDSADTHSDVSLQYGYHPSTPLSTTTKCTRKCRRRQETTRCLPAILCFSSSSTLAKKY